MEPRECEGRVVFGGRGGSADIYVYGVEDQEKKFLQWLPLTAGGSSEACVCNFTQRKRRSLVESLTLNIVLFRYRFSDIYFLVMK